MEGEMETFVKHWSSYKCSRNGRSFTIFNLISNLCASLRLEAGIVYNVYAIEYVSACSP